MAYTPASYQALTIVALFLAGALLIFFAIVYTQNQNKLRIVDTIQRVIQGPVSQLGIGNPQPGNPQSSHSVSIRDRIGKEQLALYLSTPQRLTFFTSTGMAHVPLV
jgi:hypothetical protein